MTPSSPRCREFLDVAHIVHVTGAADAGRAQSQRDALSPGHRERYHVHAYLDEMPQAMHAADLVISRAGASTLGELPAAGAPAILVPGEYEGWSQAPNAEYLQSKGAAVMLRNDRAGPPRRDRARTSRRRRPARVDVRGHARAGAPGRRARSRATADRGGRVRVANVPQRVHLVGIGGAHMSAIAQILHAWGHTITGSDQRPSAMTEKLASLGIEVTIGHAAENVGDAELVVITSAAHDDNPEIAEANRRGIPVIKRAEMVARLMHGRYSIAVAGTHGKTTTSGLIAHMLVQANLDPTYLIGGEVRSLGSNAAPGEGRYIVVEADEYDRAFLSYTPDVAIVLNIEPDHLDIYGDAGAVQDAFAQFMASTPIDGHVIACADSPRVRETVGAGGIRATDVRTYALEQPASWQASDVVEHDATQTFDVDAGGAKYGSFTIGLSGRHNVSNALAGIVAGDTIGLEKETMRAALASYRGAQRRFELVGEAAGVTVMDDYAHHPTEVREGTIAAARQRFPGRRLVLLFQPHTYTRTAYLLDEWKTCFEGADALYITHTYAAREEPAAGLSGRDLAEAVRAPGAVYIEDFEDAAERIAADLRPGDVFFTVGAGDVDRVGPMVLQRLRRKGAP